jgi:hypothetical protein
MEEIDHLRLQRAWKPKHIFQTYLAETQHECIGKFLYGH